MVVVGNNAQSYLLGLLIGLVEAKFQFAIGDSNGRDAFGTTARLPSITGQRYDVTSPHNDILRTLFHALA